MESQELEYVGFWARVGAALIDSLLLWSIILPLLLVFYGKAYWSGTDWVHGPMDFLLSWVFPAVATIVFWAMKQATPGKMVISAQIVDAHTGQAPSLGQYLGRYAAYFLATLPLCLGLIWVGLDARKQGWHDKLAGTVVVRIKKPREQKVTFAGESLSR